MALTGVTNRKYFADLFPEIYGKKTVQRSVATVLVKSPAGEGDLTIDPIGQALLYTETAGEYVMYRTGDTVPATGDTVAFGAKVAVLAGGPQSLGDNAKDLVVTEAGVLATVVFQEASCVTDRIDFDAGVSGPEALAFTNQLRTQGIEKVEAAVPVSPAYTEA